MSTARLLRLPPGLMIASPASGSGKTVTTLGLLRALARRGLAVQAFKCGPDYIDPAFHAAASGRPSYNLDSWAMDRAHAAALLEAGCRGADIAVAEALMGLFDGTEHPGAWGNGASADLAAATGWPVILVLDVSGQAQTAAAVARGLAGFREDVRVTGVLLNRTGSTRHVRLVQSAIEAAGLPVFGALPRSADMALPERHLGLVQAGETDSLPARLDAFARIVEEHTDVTRLLAACQPGAFASLEAAGLPPPGQRIALAQDAAFSFAYPHLLAFWRAAGAEIVPFSPLAGETPDAAADILWLPGGYPELHAGRIAACGRFVENVRRFACTRPVHGECGGYMVLGTGIVDLDGTRHRMLGLLGLETSFASRRLHLGYRRARLIADGPLGRAGTVLTGHEFHYATVTGGTDEPFAGISDAAGNRLPEAGSRRGNVTGTFFHLIGRTGTP